MSYSPISHGGSARVSTLIVDAQIDTGAFGIKADIIEESTAGAGVSITPAEWTSMDLSASDELRAFDATELLLTNQWDYTKVKTLNIPARYNAGQTCRVTTAIKSLYAGPVRYVKVYVNGVAAGVDHSTDSLSFVTFTDDVVVGGGDTVEMWVSVQGGGASCGHFAVYGSDSRPDVFFSVGEAWP